MPMKNKLNRIPDVSAPKDMFSPYQPHQEFIPQYLSKAP